MTSQREGRKALYIQLKVEAYTRFEELCRLEGKSKTELLTQMIELWEPEQPVQTQRVKPKPRVAVPRLVAPVPGAKTRWVDDD